MTHIYGSAVFGALSIGIVGGIPKHCDIGPNKSILIACYKRGTRTEELLSIASIRAWLEAIVLDNKVDNKRSGGLGNHNVATLLIYAYTLLNNLLCRGIGHKSDCYSQRYYIKYSSHKSNP